MRFEACNSDRFLHLSQSERSAMGVGYYDSDSLSREVSYSVSDLSRGDVRVCGKKCVVLVAFHVRLVNASVETGPAVFCCYYQGHFVSSNNSLGVIEDYLNELGFPSSLSGKDQGLL